MASVGDPGAAADTPAPVKRSVSDRQALNAILFVLHTGIAWRDVPRELGYGSGATAWQRLNAWQAAGVWERIHRELLVRLQAVGEIDWSRAVADSSHISALWGLDTGPSPVDRARTGSKHQLHLAFMHLACAVICWRRLRAAAS